MVIPALAAASGLSGIAAAIASLYGIASSINDYVDRHIEDMKGSSNPTVAKTGRILDGAKYGFGLGYLSSVTIIAAGQYLLGNTLAAVSTIATAAVVSNPIAMTCAAVGAIFYGWKALSDSERNDILDKLAHGLEIGVELIKAIIGFVLQSAQSLFGSQALKEFKVYIAEKAQLFGRSLSDVTRQTVDVVSDAALSVKRKAGVAVSSTARVANDAADKLGGIARQTVDAVGDAASSVKRQAGVVASSTARVATGATDIVGEALSDVGRAAGTVMSQTGEVAQQLLKEGRNVVLRPRNDRLPK